MRIACPSCAAEYEVPTSRMTPRRMVRCERCGNEWVAVQEAEENLVAAEPSDAEVDLAGPEEEMASLPPAAANVTAMDRLAPSRLHGRRDVGLVAAWIASVVLLVGAATATILCRSDVVRAWPASARLLGSPPVVVATPPHAPSGAPAKTVEKSVKHE